MWKKVIRKTLHRLGYSLIRTESLPPEVPPDLSPEVVEIYQTVRPYTMTSAERVAALVEAVRYLASANVEGSIVECGVWRGGSIMAVAKTLLEIGDSSRELFLFDTFEGMPEPGPEEVDFLDRSGAALLDDARKLTPKEQLESYLFAYSPLEVVKTNIMQTGYPEERIHFIKGKVEDTIPTQAPEKISLLRLDTDWYESTRHELIHLFPRLSRGGVIIIDDYGHWRGCRRAVDEYLEENKITLLLNRIDYTGRSAVIR